MMGSKSEYDFLNLAFHTLRQLKQLNILDFFSVRTAICRCFHLSKKSVLSRFYQIVFNSVFDKANGVFGLEFFHYIFTMRFHCIGTNE